MKQTIQIISIACLLLFCGYDPCSAQHIPNVKGDGVHDDTKGLQALLDTNASVVSIPKPSEQVQLLKDAGTIHVSNKTNCTE